MKKRVYVEHWYSRQEMSISQALEMVDEDGRLDAYRVQDTLAQLIEALNELSILPPEKILSILRAAGVYRCQLVDEENDNE